MGKPKKATRKRQSPFLPHTHPSFRPYAQALGQVALAWNELHEAMGSLFCLAMGGGYTNQLFAVWHAVKVDRAQRDILLAAAKNQLHPEYPPSRRADLQQGIEWACGKANSLEDTRNDVVHSPLYSYSGGIGEGTVVPGSGLGHVRAGKLADKGDVLASFRWCRDTATLLTRFVQDMEAAVMDAKRPWPGKPKLPARPDANAKKPLRRGRKAKRPPPPPPSPP